MWTESESAIRVQRVTTPRRGVADHRRCLLRAAAYAAAGGSVRTEIIDGAGHSPHLDAAPRWLAIFQDFLATIG